MRLLAPHYRWDFHCALCLPLVTYFDVIFPDGERQSWGRDPAVISLELVPQMACPSDSSPYALAYEPSSVVATRDKALHAPKISTANIFISAIRHRHDCGWRVFTI
jgi:hypothetical protein